MASTLAYLDSGQAGVPVRHNHQIVSLQVHDTQYHILPPVLPENGQEVALCGHVAPIHRSKEDICEEGLSGRDRDGVF